VTLTWKNMLKFSDGEWKPEDPIANTSSGVLVGSFNWTDGEFHGSGRVCLAGTEYTVLTFIILFPAFRKS
jgi:hypothetical protein